MIARTTLAGSVLALAAVWTMPSDARACSCFFEQHVVWPIDGGTAPANTLILVDGACGPLDGSGIAHTDLYDVVVTVDGVDATLALNDDMARAAGLGIVVVDPPLLPGAAVEISAHGDTIAFTVTEADDTAPAPPELDPIDYELVSAPLDCGENSMPARDWTVGVAQGDSEPRLYLVELGPEAGEPTTRTAFTVDEASLQLEIRRLEEDAGEEVCAQVHSFDMAGNAAPVVDSCRELANDETLDGGCACTAGRESSPSAWGLLGLVGWWRRRRRAAARTA